MNVIRVMIVEDDPMVADLNRRYLEQMSGFSLVGLCRSGEEAVEALKEKEVDLMLVDVYMPGMSGLDLINHIRKEQYGVDVILVTAAKDQKSILEALRQGAVDYLVKPFQFDRFQGALQRYRQRCDWMNDLKQVSQEELDRKVFSRSQPEERNGLLLPKGVERNTLRRVWESVNGMEKEFTAEEMAAIVGISQVSIRKYLKFLQELGLLVMEAQYGAVGRPVNQYRYNQGAPLPKNWL